MRKIKYFDNELSVEEYIKIQLVRNDGIRSLVYRKDLIEECASRNIQTKATSTKEQLVELRKVVAFFVKHPNLVFLHD